MQNWAEIRQNYAWIALRVWVLILSLRLQALKWFCTNLAPEVYFWNRLSSSSYRFWVTVSRKYKKFPSYLGLNYGYCAWLWLKLDRILRSRIVSYVIEQFLKFYVIFDRFWAHLNYSFFIGPHKKTYNHKVNVKFV